MLDFAVGYVEVEFTVIIKIGKANPEARVRQAVRSRPLRLHQVDEIAVGVEPKAIPLGFKELETNPQNADAQDVIALSYAKIGKGKEAENFINRARAIDKKNVNYMYDQAKVFALGGRSKEALKSLKEALDNHYPCQTVSEDLDLESLHNTADFKALVSKCAVQPAK